MHPLRAKSPRHQGSWDLAPTSKKLIKNIKTKAEPKQKQKAAPKKNKKEQKKKEAPEKEIQEKRDEVPKSSQKKTVWKVKEKLNKPPHCPRWST